VRVVTKGGVPRILPLSQEAYQILWRRQNHHETHFFTFVAQRTRPCPKTGKKFIKGERYPITYYGIVPGLYRRPISHYATAAMNDLHGFNIPVLPHLPLGVVMNEAAAYGVPVTTFAPETVQAESFRQIAETLDAYREQETAGPVVPVEEDFDFENFISDVSNARNANDNGSRKKLYDLMPKRPRPPH